MPDPERTCGDCRLPILPACRCEYLVSMGEDGRLIMELRARVAELETAAGEMLATLRIIMDLIGDAPAGDDLDQWAAVVAGDAQ